MSFPVLTPPQFKGGVTLVPVYALVEASDALDAWNAMGTTDYPIEDLVALLQAAVDDTPDKYAEAGNVLVPIETVYQLVNAYSIWDTQVTIPPEWQPAESDARAIRDNFTVAFQAPGKPVLWNR